MLKHALTIPFLTHLANSCEIFSKLSDTTITQGQSIGQVVLPENFEITFDLNLGAEHELPITCATEGCYNGQDFRNLISVGPADSWNVRIPSFTIHPLISTHLYNLRCDWTI